MILKIFESWDSVKAIVSLSDQIAITIGLFSAIAGMAVTIIGLVITAYILRRKDPDKTPKAQFIRLSTLLTFTYILTLSPVAICMFVIGDAMNGNLIENGLFLLNRGPFTSWFLYGINAIFNLIAVIGFILIQRKADLRYYVEISFSGILIVFDLLFASLIYTNDGILLSTLCILCFLQLCFGLLQIWLLLRK